MDLITNGAHPLSEIISGAAGGRRRLNITSMTVDIYNLRAPSSILTGQKEYIDGDRIASSSKRVYHLEASRSVAAFTEVTIISTHFLTAVSFFESTASLKPGYVSPA